MGPAQLCRAICAQSPGCRGPGVCARGRLPKLATSSPGLRASNAADLPSIPGELLSVTGDRLLYAMGYVLHERRSCSRFFVLLPVVEGAHGGAGILRACKNVG